MLVNEQWMRENYNMFNEKYWNGELPHIQFKTSNAVKTWGFASYRYDYVRDTITPIAITLSNYYDAPEKTKLGTLLHEMVHIADYHFHPEHFIKNGRPISRRYYDAHGPVFFLKEAARLNKDGWEIQKYVSQTEMDSAELSQANLDKHKKRLDKGVQVYIIKYINPIRGSKTKQYFDYGYLLVGKTNAENCRREANWASSSAQWIKLFISKDPNIMKIAGTTKRCWRLINDLENFKTKYSLEYVETIHQNKNFEPEDDGVAPIDTNINEPIKPSRKFVFKTSSNNVIEIPTDDKEVIRKELEKRFPNWSALAIEKILNNSRFYMDNKVSENRLSEIIRETLNEMIGHKDITAKGPEDLDPNAEIKFLGNGNFEYSIE